MKNNDKVNRVLNLYTKLMDGYIIDKKEEAQNYGINERSIQRDIDDIRNFLDEACLEDGVMNSVVFDRAEKGYRLERIYKMKFTNSEVLAICKILLGSRAFIKDEMYAMLFKLIDSCVPESNQRLVKDLISNEMFHYIELQHKTVFIDKMWDIGQAIRSCQQIEIEYTRTKDQATVKRKIKPVAIMFSEYYFYLTAFIDDGEIKQGFEVLNDSFPTIYRIDRIKHLKVLGECFHIPYSSRFEEGEFRKRIQFMYGGKLHKVKFRYYGQSVEAILDKLPTAEIISEDEKGYTIVAEVFGKGIDMWLRSQGENVELIC